MDHVSKTYTKFIMIAPSFAMFSLFIYYNLIVAFSYSTTNFTGIGAKKFIGLRNYVRLFHDSYFLISIRNTLIILVMMLIISIPFSLLMSVLMNKEGKLYNAYKVMNFTPVIIAPIIAGLIWMFIFDPSMGMINMILKSIGLGSLNIQWIGGTKLTPYSVSIIEIWKQSGFLIVLLLAGLKTISADLYEAARIDGASSAQTLKYITIPMLKEPLRMCVILVVTSALKTFESVYVLTGGGPDHYSESIVSYMYNKNFESYQYGYGTAISVVLFFMIAGVTILFLVLTNKDNNA